MKNVKLMLLAATAMLLLGMGNVSAQVSSVMVDGYTKGGHTVITVIHPNYERIQNIYDVKNKDFHVALKEELDKWTEQGYEVIDSSIASGSVPEIYRIIYYLTKKD